MIKSMKSFTILSFFLVMFSNGKNITAQETFKSIKIGNQTWMAENLNVNRFRNGDSIPEMKTKEEWIKTGNEGKPAWCYYDNDPENGQKYGKLYNWFAINDKRGLVPKGWHIPTKAEFETLVATVNNDANALKAIGQGTGKSAGSNSSGFSALLAGYRHYISNFLDLGSYANFWSSTEHGVTYAYYLYLIYDDSKIYLYNFNKAYGFSVRCIKD